MKTKHQIQLRSGEIFTIPPTDGDLPQHFTVPDNGATFVNIIEHFDSEDTITVVVETRRSMKVNSKRTHRLVLTLSGKEEWRGLLDAFDWIKRNKR